MVVHFSYFRVQFKDDASFSTAHTSYVARDGRGTDSFFSVAVVTKQGYLLRYAGKADLRHDKGYLNPKRKLGVTKQFSEIIKLQFGKKCHTIFCICDTLLL